MEQELKKAAGEDKKPRLKTDGEAVPEGIADEELVKELAQHEDAAANDGPKNSETHHEEDEAEKELEQEKEVAEKAAELKAAQEEEIEKEEQEEKDRLKDADKVG